jgi:hypothetical protein
MLDQRLPKIRLRVLVPEVNEFKYERVANRLLWREVFAQLDISCFP